MTETESMVKRVAKAIREKIKVDATGLAPAVASAYIVGIEDAARAAIDPVIDHAVAIMEARLPLYTDIAARNAIRECISSIKASALVKALEE